MLGYQYHIHIELFAVITLSNISFSTTTTATEYKLEQLERLHSEDTPRHLMITHTIESYWIPRQKKTKSKLQIKKIRQNFKIFEFQNGHYTRHTFWSCLIRCANMKLIRWVLLKIQSGHDSVHRRTDGQGDTSIPPFQLRWNGGIMSQSTHKRHPITRPYDWAMGCLLRVVL